MPACTESGLVAVSVVVVVNITHRKSSKLGVVSSRWGKYDVKARASQWADTRENFWTGLVGTPDKRIGTTGTDVCVSAYGSSRKVVEMSISQARYSFSEFGEILCYG